MHVWRLAKKDLAVGSELLRRKIKLGVRCVVCSRDETLIHHFWTCPHAARTWEIIRVVQATAPGFSYQGAQLQRFVELVAGLDRQSTGARPCVGLMTVYQLWLARNYKRDTARIEDPQVIVKRTTFLVKEWMGLKSASTGANGSPVLEQWCPPGEGRHISNADGAFLQAAYCSGGEAVLHDHHGRFLAGSCRFFPAVPAPERAKMFMEMGVMELVMKTDCPSVVVKLRNKELDRSMHGPLIEDIKAILRSFEDHDAHHVRQSANEVAHRLAKDVCENNLCKL